MKKISIIVMALVFLVALTQCKKEQATPANDGKTVDITLDIKSGKGTRMDVNTATGEVTFVSGDKIYVASGGKYVGTLTHNGTRFSGTITDPVVGEPLHFYFLGNVTPAETLTAGTTTTCSVVISDQTQHLPVIEYAPSNETYNSGVTTFTAHLLNKCALVKFIVTTLSEAATCITGMKNKVTVSFADNTLTHSQEGNGLITLPSGSGEKWAILLPQETMEEGSAYSEDGDYAGSCGEVPAIYENGYFTVGISVEVINGGGSGGGFPIGIINGLFSVSETQQVYFSQGNLQYIGSAAIPYWKFADNQWEYFGTTTNQNSSAPNVDRDLFCWGTSGYDHGALSFQPWSIIMSYDRYYAYGEETYNLYDQTGQADWGYNAIANGGNQENIGWHTLTKDEWVYVFNGRTNAGLKWGQGNVNGVNGVILLPDDWILPEGIGFFFSAGSDWFNSYTTDQWALMEANGAVFLPSARQRRGNSISDSGKFGYYWSSSCDCNNPNSAYCLYFYTNGSAPSYSSVSYYGNSVRLVHNVE